FSTLDTQTVKVEIVRVIVCFEQLVRILACSLANGDEVKCDDVRLSRISRGKEISEAQMFSGRLARKSEAHFPFLVVNDQIVAFCLTVEITVDHFRHEQLFTFRAFFDLFIDRSNFIAYQRLILFERHSTLLELPLTFEQRSLVYEPEHIIKRNVV